MAASKISLTSLSDLKGTLDDHVPLYLTSPNTTSSTPLSRTQLWTQNHTSTYVRLALGYAAVGIAMYIFYLDYVLKQDFAVTKEITTYAVVVYFTLNSLFTLWTWFGEKGLIFHGSKSSGNIQTDLKIWTNAPKTKYDPTYCMTAEWSSGSGKQQKTERDVKFMGFFTSDGYFVPEKFEEWLGHQIPVIEGGGQKGHRTVKAVEIPPPRVLAGDDGDTIVVGGSPVKQSATADTPSKKRGRGRPKNS